MEGDDVERAGLLGLGGLFRLGGGRLLGGLAAVALEEFLGGDHLDLAAALLAHEAFEHAGEHLGVDAGLVDGDGPHLAARGGGGLVETGGELLDELHLALGATDDDGVGLRIDANEGRGFGRAFLGEDGGDVGGQLRGVGVLEGDDADQTTLRFGAGLVSLDIELRGDLLGHVEHRTGAADDQGVDSRFGGDADARLFDRAAGDGLRPGPLGKAIESRLGLEDLLEHGRERFGPGVLEGHGANAQSLDVDRDIERLDELGGLVKLGGGADDGDRVAGGLGRHGGVGFPRR